MPNDNDKIDINKHEVDIETLKKQNVNDLLSIKELYRKIEKIGEKISQINYIDTKLAEKLKKDYENLKKVLLNENIHLQLPNDINEISSQLGTNILEATKRNLINTSNYKKEYKCRSEKIAEKVESVNGKYYMYLEE